MRTFITIYLLSVALAGYSQNIPYPNYDPLFYDHEHHANELIFQVDSAYQMHHFGDNWAIDGIYKVTERDGSDRMTKADQFDLNEAGEFELTRKLSTVYNVDGSILLFLKEIWNPDSSAWVTNEKQVWDSSGNLLENTSKNWNFDLPEACLGFSDLYNYNSNNQLTEKLSKQWQLAPGWYNVERKLYTFDSANMLSQYIYQQSGYGIDWYNVTKMDYLYEAGQNTYTMIYAWKPDLEIWRKTWKRTQLFDTNNYLVQVMHFEPITDTTYQFNNRFTYTNNQAGMVTAELVERYDTINEIWNPYGLLQIDYLNDTNMTMYTNLSWDEDSSIWRSSWRRNYEYTEDFQLSNFLMQYNNINQWTNSEQRYSEYDEFGKQISYQYDLWKYGSEHIGYWSPYYKEEYFWPTYVGVSDQKMKGAVVNVYPNPGNGILHFNYRLPDGIEHTELSLFSVNGALMDKFELNKQEGDLQFDCSSMKPGFYYYSISSLSGNTTGKLIIVN
ncbi:MAG: T9SS type A sorting domain-containing protein [Bacteroidales bacterium]|nr:T9SS type A sorting domain-containing protein [Bacteroidales bacterium]